MLWLDICSTDDDEGGRVSSLVERWHMLNMDEVEEA